MTAEGTDRGAIRRLSAREIAAAVRRGDLSAAAVVEAHLARIQDVEPRLGAFLEVFEGEARERAGEIDRQTAAGKDPGPLAGVPLAVKDNLALAGHRLTCGSRILDGYRSPYTATAVARLVDAGAVVVGKTNLDELGMGSSCERSAFGFTRNPWDPERVPGGSSGGSAAAVAAGCVPLALGTDTGGSVRQPAALCGVTGCRPSWGRVSRWGVVAFASSLDQVGPLSRSVGDAALALFCMAGADDRDATCSTRPVDRQWTREGHGESLDGWRVGVIPELEQMELGLGDPAEEAVSREDVPREDVPREAVSREAVSREAVSPDVRRNWEESLQRLEDLGAQVTEVSVPNAAASLAAYQVVASCEASANLARFDGVRYGRRAAPEDGVQDLTSLYVESRSRGFGAEVKRRILLGTFALSRGYREAYYRRALGVREALRRQLARAFERLDVVAAPTAPEAAFGLGERLQRPLAMYRSDRYTALASLAGLPAVAVPSGLNEEGLPLSIQFLGRPFDETRVLRAARAFERRLGFTCRPVG